MTNITPETNEMLMQTVLNFNTQLSAMKELWVPKTVAESEEHIFKLVKVQGEFTWHIHDTAKVLIVFAGSMSIDFRDTKTKEKNKETMVLNKGDMCLVPGNSEHKPYAEEECEILLIEVKDI